MIHVLVLTDYWEFRAVIETGIRSRMIFSFFAIRWITLSSRLQESSKDRGATRELNSNFGIVVFRNDCEFGVEKLKLERDIGLYFRFLHFGGSFCPLDCGNHRRIAVPSVNVTLGKQPWSAVVFGRSR